ncbi:TetR/AcrR family transcriptional regulator [Flavobacterium sp. CYK-4]|uniref:TetR family transcriptional regulator C-terminal domain-containing protein n=1 Tax=Flavobacterium lotistagni TaxID=2709660 RepID=UPI00140B6A62|nr:TetR family transcriptional regulator C-terminal domain-containing protein [Flavobacterium lotistagni]NHM06365.1 TetR/AcrR family transcriptional regulator [Flavobacterium lotistagni]
MAASKKTTTKKKQINDLHIITVYMDDVLENPDANRNVYTFCKTVGIEESDFYSFFSSMEHLRQMIWVQFFENVQQTIAQDSSYSTYTDKNKLLTLYFSLFELLTLNRSYVLHSLKENGKGLENLMDLKLFRQEFKAFVGQIIKENQETELKKLDKFSQPFFSEGAWIQFLFLLKYWLHDSSKGFEKTDVLIEKSVNTVVDLLDTKPLENLIDLGKFLWKERAI